MNRPPQIQPITLVALLLAFGGLISLSACDNKTSNTSTPTESPTTEQSQSTTQKSSEESSGDTPITVGLENSDRPNTDPLQLLENEQIKQELNITDEQLAKLNEVETNLRQEMNQTVSGVKWKELSKEEQSAKLKEVSQEIDTKIQASRQKIGEILKPEQVTRMKQIFLQIYGWGVLTKDDFTEELKLTAEQQSELNEIRDDMVAKMQTNWEVPAGNDAASRNKVIANNQKRMEQIVKESNDKAIAVLTPEQKQQLETLKGEKFDFKPPQPQT